jgi:uncharacterized coiled-coil protein SlyX
MENRIFELEKRMTYLEKYVDELNSVVIEQQTQLDRFYKNLTQLRSKDQDSPVDPSGNHDEKPPHY